MLGWEKTRFGGNCWAGGLGKPCVITTNPSVQSLTALPILSVLLFLPFLFCGVTAQAFPFLFFLGVLCFLFLQVSSFFFFFSALCFRFLHLPPFFWISTPPNLPSFVSVLLGVATGGLLVFPGCWR